MYFGDKSDGARDGFGTLPYPTVQCCELPAQIPTIPELPIEKENYSIRINLFFGERHEVIQTISIVASRDCYSPTRARTD